MREWPGTATRQRRTAAPWRADRHRSTDPRPGVSPLPEGTGRWCDVEGVCVWLLGRGQGRRVRDKVQARPAWGPGPSLCLETSAPLFSSLSSRCRWESRQRPSQTTRPNGVPRPRQCHFWLPGIVTPPCLVLRGVYQQLKWSHRLLAHLFIRVSFLLLSRRGRHPIA